MQLRDIEVDLHRDATQFEAALKYSLVYRVDPLNVKCDLKYFDLLNFVLRDP